MKILMVTPYLPYPPASGGQIRTLNLLKYLSRDNEIILVSLYKNKQQKKYLKYLKPFCQQIYLCKRPEKPWRIDIVLKAIFSRKPFLIVRNFSIEAKDTIQKLLKEQKFDVIHLETFYVMPHLPKTNIPTLLVEQTIEYEVYQHFVETLPVLIRPFFYIDILKLKYWERHYWKKASLVATVSISDEEKINKIEPKIFPVIIPNGAGDDMLVDKLPSKLLYRPILLFVGNFFWLQNEEAANFLIKEIFPKLKRVLKNFQLIIAGQEAKRINHHHDRQLQIIDIAPSNSKTIKKLYHQATLFVAPIYGPGGTRLKILASMASGLPVIGTKIGFEGLSVEDNIHVLVADDSDSFVKEIVHILNNENLYKKLQANSFIKVKEIYSWDKIAQLLINIYKTIQKQK